MSLNLCLTPAGRLAIEAAPEITPHVSAKTATLLYEAFAASNADAFAASNACGLLRLASQQVDEELPAAFVYWRGFARQLIESVCRLGEGGFDQWTEIPVPSPDDLTQLVAEAPPMRGLEYLTPEWLAAQWKELRAFVAAAAARHPESPSAWLRSIGSVWHQLGRVTFHLAENKRDPERPFAFLATYTHKLSGQSRLQHLPLAEALKMYAGTGDRSRLESLLLPVRRAAEQSALVRELLDRKTLFAPQAWTIEEAHRFLKQAAQIEQSGVVLRLPDWWTPRQPPRPHVQVQLGSRQASEVGTDRLLDFQVSLALDGKPLTAEEQRQLLASTEGLVLLRGKWVEADRDRLQQALDHWKKVEQSDAAGIDFIAGMRLLAGAAIDGGDAVDQEVAAWSRITAGDWLQRALDRLRDPSHSDSCQPGRDLNATLRPYQADGVRWLWFMTELGLGACLADDMGLGKTIQVIDFLLQRKRAAADGAASTGLLVVPASLLGNWRQELARFAPQLRVLFAHRAECDAECLARLAANPRRELAGIDLLVTTYGLVRRQNWLEQVRWPVAILDEAQSIKNSASTQTKSIKKLPAAARIILTGTPVENHLGDLWSLFDFCSPGLLGTAAQFKQFVKKLNQQQDSHAYGALRRLVQPYILRRLKTDSSIISDLPAKTEMRTECGLSKKQAALYQRAVDDLARRLEKSEGIARRGLVLSTLLQFKQICNHPAQFLSGSTLATEESGKFERLKLLCEPIAQRQERVLVFTQFQSLTGALADFLAGVFGRAGLVLHGGTPVKKRAELVAAFQAPDGPPFFVISLKAGGSGLNLTAASHVVHFDRWWNPAVENQATDRAFRIGQKRNVLVHKFVCRGTIEERIDAMIAAKQAVADQILNDEGELKLTELNDDELLRFVALDVNRATADD